MYLFLCSYLGQWREIWKRRKHGLDPFMIAPSDAILVLRRVSELFRLYPGLLGYTASSQFCEVKRTVTLMGRIVKKVWGSFC